VNIGQVRDQVRLLDLPARLRIADACLASACSTRLNSAIAISIAFGSNVITALNTSSARRPLPAASAETTDNRCATTAAETGRYAAGQHMPPGGRPCFMTKCVPTVRACRLRILSACDHTARAYPAGNLRCRLYACLRAVRNNQSKLSRDDLRLMYNIAIFGVYVTN